MNNVTSTDDQGGGIDSLMAGQGHVVLDTDDIDYETEHDSRYGPMRTYMSSKHIYQSEYNIIRFFRRSQ